MVGKQMKILSGLPQQPIYGCMLARIVEHVRSRYAPRNELEISGPMLLQKCFANHSNGVAVTYMDTRSAVWPYTGLRTRNRVLAYERAGRNMGPAPPNSDYASMSRAGNTYIPECALHAHN